MGKLAKQIEQQIDADLDQAFTAFVKFIWLELSTEVVSPTYTGFFASSWKVSNTRPRPKDQVEKFTPWRQIKKTKYHSFEKRILFQSYKNYSICDFFLTG